MQFLRPCQKIPQGLKSFCSKSAKNEEYQTLKSIHSPQNDPLEMQSAVLTIMSKNFTGRPTIFISGSEIVLQEFFLK